MSEKDVSKYNWKVRFKKPYFELREGQDYTAQTHGLITTLRQKAKDYGKRVSIRVAKNPKDKKLSIIKVTVVPLTQKGKPNASSAA